MEQDLGREMVPYWAPEPVWSSVPVPVSWLVQAPESLWARVQVMA
jgi:hypothetical protein